MGWALLPTSWFTNEYNRHMQDTQTYKQIINFNLPQHITDSNNFVQKLKTRFHNLISASDKPLYNTLEPSNVQLPFMKLLPKVHKLSSSASPHLLEKLTGRPIITAHSWTTSNISKILGTELDNIILKLKDHFVTHNIPFPLIYNSSDLIDKLEQFTIKNIHDYNLTTFDFSSLYTNITYQDTTNAIIQSCKLLHLPNFYRDYLLNLNNYINDRNYFTIGQSTFKQTRGIAMGSYHSRQMADIVLLLCELKYFKSVSTNLPLLFSRYIDDGFLLTNKSNTNQHITDLASFYPKQIPINFSSNKYTVHYLDLTISLNYYTLLFNKIHFKVYQKPHHKYMYPHFSSNHPQHVFKGLIKTETIRYSRLSSTVTDYKFIKKLFTLRLTSLDYPITFIQRNSFPFLSHQHHKRRVKRLSTSKQLIKRKPVIYYKKTYNKHIRTDKIVQHILNKYRNSLIPKLTKTYTNAAKLHTMLLTNRKLHNKLINTDS